MKLAIMQPYIFPYIGYFQLINAVDKFVVYNDVNFIKQGWINRNRILLNKQDFLFTIPLADASSFKKINEVPIHKKVYDLWKRKFYKSLTLAYSKAPFFNQTSTLIASILDKDFRTIADLSTYAIKEVCVTLDIKTAIIDSTIHDNNDQLSSKERIIDICKKESANIYINASGGTELYSKSFFLENSIQLYFLKTKEIIYKQFFEPFIPNLSIIDILMFNSTETIKQFLSSYELV